MRVGKVFRCLESPSSIRIPGSVREIGDRAFFGVNSLRDLSFEEGILKIGAYAFSWCLSLAEATFPASLIVIEANAFQFCSGLSQITFAVGSQLQYIRTEAFSFCPLIEVVIPRSIVEIDPSAFSDEVWRKSVTPLFLIDGEFILWVDSRTMIHRNSGGQDLLVGSNIEVIGANAFRSRKISTVHFEPGTRLREIGPEAFAACLRVKEFNVPESVEILGARCFEGCSNMETIEFEGSSRLKRIGERAFRESDLHSITIPALTEEIAGSAFVNCRLLSIQVAPGSLNFKVEGDFLVTSDGREIVRYFGRDPEIVVDEKVRVLGKSCFEGCKYIVEIYFEVGSELERIDRAALRDCTSLSIIDIPASIRIIEESSFEGCEELESCIIPRDSKLVTLGAKAFAKCTSLRSFSIPRQVGEIGSNCFKKSMYLYRLSFQSSESLARIIGNRSLDDALDEFGVSASSSLFRIEVGDGGMRLKFPGWTYVCGCEGDLERSLVRNVQ
jgi:hypothetical protein